MSMKDKKVVIMGLGSINNFGDNFILQSVYYLVNELENYAPEIVDFEPKMNFFNKIIYYFVLCLSKICPYKVLSYKLLYCAVKIRCKKAYKNALQNAEAIIFGGGSFKYGTQKVWAYYSLVIDLAELLDVPVMFNAMNIQRYDAKDWRCNFLREHANRVCVKVITSRDGEFGVERLIKDYQINKNKVISGVGDVAFWIPNCYEIEKRKESDVIGINLINGNIFTRYGKKTTEEELINIYMDVLHLLDKNNIKWELYTNGLKADYIFGKKLLKKYGNMKMQIKIPKSDIDLLRILCGYKRILGARLHSCIAAYSMNIPFVGMIWDEKLFYFSKMAEIECCFIEEELLSGELLLKKLLGKEIVLSDKQKEVREIWKEKTSRYIESFLSKYA